MLIQKNLPPLPPTRKNTSKLNPTSANISLAPYVRPYKIQSLKSKLLLLTSDTQQTISTSRNQSLNNHRVKLTQESINSRCNSSESLNKIKNNRIQNLQNCRMLGVQLPDISAKSWVLYELKENNCIYGKRNYKKRQMASLTKIMNLVTILQIVDRLNINMHKLKVKPTKSSISITGTTAQLKYSHIYSLYDLLFGMMLPSGNDSAYLIAQLGGFILKFQKQRQNLFNLHQLYNNAQQLISYLDKNNQYVNIYLKEMNKISHKLEMYNSNFSNPHGLSNIYNYSTASDLVKLCAFGLKNKTFRNIVTTKLHKYKIEEYFNPDENKKNLDVNNVMEGSGDKVSCNKLWEKRFLNGCWQNTNKMLDQGWSGIKTGITPNAGPCLAASFAKTINNKQYEFLVILLNSESMQARWQQVRNLVSWAIQKKYYL